MNKVLVESKKIRPTTWIRGESENTEAVEQLMVFLVGPDAGNPKGVEIESILA